MKYHHLLLLTLVLFLGASHYLGYTPLALGAIIALASMVAYVLYAKDKAAARTGSWRVPERTLHLAGLFFGWPGALLAQERLRHKTQKRRFRVVFWACVLVNVGVVGWLHSPEGNAQLRDGARQIERLTLSSLSHEAAVATVTFLTRFRARRLDFFR
ncbi:DUF1294 domain-containing protein [Gilvimarinus sp. F26214L]|uniref:DUF1294 domain-containing protein n=1 Tax=Gilvimarinus sp. DZF01 TaxID=3461371 RepID=UPI0040459EB0